MLMRVFGDGDGGGGGRMVIPRLGALTGGGGGVV